MKICVYHDDVHDAESCSLAYKRSNNIKVLLSSNFMHHMLVRRFIPPGMYVYWLYYWANIMTFYTALHNMCINSLDYSHAMHVLINVAYYT